MTISYYISSAIFLQVNVLSISWPFLMKLIHWKLVHFDFSEIAADGNTLQYLYVFLAKVNKTYMYCANII